ncbi:hypothetical protein V6R98_02320 [Agrobacterium sp. CCNWLW71]|uniref:hypothetical protein n=1 Tax=unclassified Agrobacterium TaxID=2632611 RepID=UPI002FF24EDC
MTLKVAKIKYQDGWRFYSVVAGEIGVNKLRRPKFFPKACRLNSTWMTRPEAAELIRDSRKA